MPTRKEFTIAKWLCDYCPEMSMSEMDSIVHERQLHGDGCKSMVNTADIDVLLEQINKRVDAHDATTNNYAQLQKCEEFAKNLFVRIGEIISRSEAIAVTPPVQFLTSTPTREHIYKRRRCVWKQTAGNFKFFNL
jgi:hypothetical protein